MYVETIYYLCHIEAHTQFRNDPEDPSKQPDFKPRSFKHLRSVNGHDYVFEFHIRSKGKLERAHSAKLANNE